jgi:tight adherence protein B
MNRTLFGVIAAGLASAGAYLIYTSAAFGWRRLWFGRPSGSKDRARQRPSVRVWMAQAGLGEVAPGEFAAAVLVLFVLGALGGYLLFGSIAAALVAGCLAGCVPLSSYRARRRRRLAETAQAWPGMLEELRLLTGSMGRSIPQALFEVGRHAPEEWRSSFAAAERVWQLTTDFDRTLDLLKSQLADPTADAVCETLLVANEVGGPEIDAKLEALIDDRLVDLQSRKDAESKLSGVRFARRFVLLVPLGMALAGLSIGTGRQAYTTVGGQVAVAIGLGAVAVCWWWSGRLMQLPDPPRVFR